MSVSLKGKTILITGASSGIGAATAKACVDQGMLCVVTARREDRLKKLADELGELCVPIAGDVTIGGFNKQLLAEAGDIYAVFANAGHGLDQKMIDCNADQFRGFRELFELNVFAAVELASLASRIMVDRGRGHILLCASCLSKFATPQHGAYCASKSALEAVAKSMRMELKSSGVHVSSVHPIGTTTEFSDSSAVRSGMLESEFARQVPSWSMQSPDKVANAVVRCLRHPKPEVWTSLPMRVASTIFSAFPRVAQIAIYRFS
jgi:short-subunit dehydrogenase